MRQRESRDDVSSLNLCHMKSPLGSGDEDHVQHQLQSVPAPGLPGGSESGTWHEKPLL